MQFDSAFVQRLVQHDDLAFAQFYEQSVDQFFRYLMSRYRLESTEAQDILGDVYLKIWNNIEKYNPDFQFGQFIRTILKNHCKDYFKASQAIAFSQLRQHSQTIDLDREEMWEDEDNIKDLFQQQFVSEYIDQAIGQLDQEDQELLSMRFILQYSYDTIQDISGISSQNLRKKISRIVQKLRDNLTQLEN